MKTISLVLIVGTAANVLAQGTIVFANRNIPTASGTGGGNGNGTYNVPILCNGDGVGDIAGGFTVGLFNAAGSLIGSSLLRTDLNSQFFATGSQTLTVPGVEAGSTANLVVRGWQGPGTFAEAKATGRAYMDEISFAGNAFTSRPLGGTPPGGGLPITPPGMTGWGPESGAGFELIPEPSTLALGVLGIGALFLRRRR